MTADCGMTKDTKKNRLYASMPAQRRCELVVLIFGCLAFGYVFSSCSKPENKINDPIITTTKTPEAPPIPVIDPNQDFSKFLHSNAEHARLPCSLCHERKDNSATPKFSGHLPCAGCHTAQFADNKSSICTICHTKPETGAMKPFPALQSFNVRFEHTTHIRRTNCASCHKPSGNAVAMSIPAGLTAHNSCFQCHSPGAISGEKKIDSCETCHQAGKFGGSVSAWSAAFNKTPFSHAKHNLNCATCHSTKSGAARGDQMTAPIAAMHFAPKNAQSCASCHDNKRAFGGTDFADCRRCHRGNNFKFS